ncbi:unnamed protein product [Rhizophagus irregularis]|uniref:Uncharacterized protein n=1 Tax=Rhizophagus irregularis TaxID=588596 RepID=A0A2N1P451_9GLOM|nr:hypothetical protein RhiirC2_841374 [Rhizophagus irregularis]CAB4386045.1 unnamed protein product [Rhizophagus irregularis]CAB5374083.1 unnamed protein product [Rhizophagus irregularis]
MSNLTTKISVCLVERGPSKYILVLDHKCNRFIDIKVSTSKEIYERKYKDVLNPYMIFSIDCCAGFNLAKSNKNFKPFSYSPKDIPILWENSKEVKNEYEKVFIGFKNLKPKAIKFVPYNPLEKNENENFNNKLPNEPEYKQIEHTQHSMTANNIYQPEDFPSDVNVFFNYVEENGIASNSDYSYYSEYSLSTALLYNNTFLNDDVTDVSSSLNTQYIQNQDKQS